MEETVHVTTAAELGKAIKSGAETIEIEGDLAKLAASTVGVGGLGVSVVSAVIAIAAAADGRKYKIVSREGDKLVLKK